MSDDNGAIISARNLTVLYHGAPALVDVSLSLPPGGVTAIIGPSGCGKTTFLRCLNRLTDLVEGCSVEGDLEVAGLAVTGAVETDRLRHMVGMIFQTPNPFPISVRANLHLPLREHGVRSRSTRDEIGEAVLREVGLWEEVKDRLDRSALTLSGGQQQRLCIARALTLRPRLLLMDEPCSALDPIATERIESLIASMRGRYTVVIVTHNLAQARRLADTVAVFWTRAGGGRLVAFGKTADIFERPEDPDAAAYVQGRRG